jgi:hypothetical protein
VQVENRGSKNMCRLALIARDSSSDSDGREESLARNRRGLAAGFERERRGKMRGNSGE